MSLIKELQVNAPEDFFNYLRENGRSNFLYFTWNDSPEHRKTKLRVAISVEERLAVTLRYLATGRSYEDLKFSAIISPQALSKIIPETCWVIYKKLKNEYLKVSDIFAI